MRRLSVQNMTLSPSHAATKQILSNARPPAFHLAKPISHMQNACCFLQAPTRCFGKLNRTRWRRMMGYIDATLYFIQNVATLHSSDSSPEPAQKKTTHASLSHLL
ncbi:hypothetical protein QCA50_016723 [Cerrena zonata]|uniref:Uncharacterized protein n=1 Tax=Cerrena zonata TaxID=2478898 RepID=A0AAW0FPR8_9APHY